MKRDLTERVDGMIIGSSFIQRVARGLELAARAHREQRGAVRGKNSPESGSTSGETGDKCTTMRRAGHGGHGGPLGKRGITYPLYKVLRFSARCPRLDVGQCPT